LWVRQGAPCVFVQQLRRRVCGRPPACRPRATDATSDPWSRWRGPDNALPDSLPRERPPAPLCHPPLPAPVLSSQRAVSWRAYGREQPKMSVISQQLLAGTPCRVVGGQRRPARAARTPASARTQDVATFNGMRAAGPAAKASQVRIPHESPPWSGTLPPALPAESGRTPPDGRVSIDGTGPDPPRGSPPLREWWSASEPPGPSIARLARVLVSRAFRDGVTHIIHDVSHRCCTRCSDLSALALPRAPDSGRPRGPYLPACLMSPRRDEFATQNPSFTLCRRA